MNSFIRHTICPLLAAFIWGTAFTAQRICGMHLQPFTIIAVRNLIASVILGGFCVIVHKNPGKIKDLIIGGTICGTALFLAANLQQFGLVEVSAGKSGFITALYIVLVPVLGIFLKRPAGIRVWIAVAIAVAGMYFLCITESFSIGKGDINLLLCALMFAIQIMCIDYYANILDNVALSAAQFFVTGLLSLIFAVIFKEKAEPGAFRACLGSLIYVTMFSSCIAYTLQTVSQKGGNPSIISLILSLEAVFAVVGGTVILHETMTNREWLGCALMVFAIVIAQLPGKKQQT